MIGRQLSKEDRSVRATDGMGKHHQADSESTVSGKEIRRKERMEVPEVQHLGGVPEVNADEDTEESCPQRKQESQG